MTPAGGATDEELMERLADGQELALNSLMERWEIPLRKFLFRYLQNDSESLDIAQEVFVKVYQNRSRFSPGMRFSPWMFTIAANLARNRFRWRSRHPSEPIDASEESGSAAKEGLRDDFTPASHLYAVERAEAVRQAIAELPEDLRTAILLFEYEDMPHAEIAQVLACSPKAVESRLYRARQALKKSLCQFFSKNSRV